MRYSSEGPPPGKARAKTRKTGENRRQGKIRPAVWERLISKEAGRIRREKYRARTHSEGCSARKRHAFSVHGQFRVSPVATFSVRNPPSLLTFTRVLGTILPEATSDRASGRAPPAVIHGDNDEMIPVAKPWGTHGAETAGRMITTTSTTRVCLLRVGNRVGIRNTGSTRGIENSGERPPDFLPYLKTKTPPSESRRSLDNFQTEANNLRQAEISLPPTVTRPNEV